MERPSASGLRQAGYRASVPPPKTIRAVTPELTDRTPSPRYAASTTKTTTTTTNDPVSTPATTNLNTVALASSPLPATGRDAHPPLPSRPRTVPALSSPHASPRPPHGTPADGPVRRQGMVFNDSFDGPPDSRPDDSAGDAPALSSSPPAPRLPPRQRTYTMEAGSARHPPVSLTTVADSRRRIGSFSTPGSQQQGPDAPWTPDSLEAYSLSPTATSRHSESPHADQYLSQRAQLTKDKKPSSRRLVKRQSSRPTSPPPSAPPSVDSLPLPIPTDDANKVLLLMKNLCGRMRGDVEYQLEAEGPWEAGMAYIEEEKGSLMFDSGQDGPFHACLIADLRGCRVIPVDYPDNNRYNCLEIVSSHPPIDLLLRPLDFEEVDLWLAALLCWQQLRPVSGPMMNGKPTSPVAPTRPELRRHTSAGQNAKPTSIIKVGRVMLWDKGLATSPRAIVKRPSTRDLRSPTTTWRRVSCILQDNGELKLLTESDSSILSVIELSQLSRCAIQPLDRTVLDEEFCIAIFPIYASTSTQLSIFRPVYIALDARVHFEVWFVLLRAFAAPDLYRLDGKDGIVEMTEAKSENLDGLFRIEKHLTMRVTEAKLRTRTAGPSETPNSKGDFSESLTGNYLAEIILDGEVRARTTIKTHTKNPFWRTDCTFYDLPPSLPFLSIVLKRVDGYVDTPAQQSQASLVVPKPGSATEIMCGSVDIPLEDFERGRDHEQWLPILDDKQQCIGTMLIRLYHEELVVLLENDYKPLSDLLHRFPAGLTSQVADVMPSSLRRLAEIFLNIFQVSGSAAEWLMALVEDEIDGIGSQASIKKFRFSRRLRSTESLESTSDREQIVRDMSRSLTGEANLLFRGNSLLTQSLEFHMRRLGKDYLQDVLIDKVVEINIMNPDCEVDPSRIHDADELQYHWTRLIRITTEVWECIVSSANRLPPELRHILKYIRAVAEDRYGDFLRTVSYTSVSGFLFLRFICPAILSPKIFGLLRDFPRARAQRTLTLVAKTLQALANMTTFGQKEGWMEPMNKFLASQRGPMKEFIDEVCAIPADRSTNPLPASYTTPLTMLGRLSPAAKEGFRSLPYLIDQSRNLAALVRFWADTNPLARTPPPPAGGGPSSPSVTVATTVTGTNANTNSNNSAASPVVDTHAAASDGDLRLFNDICMDLQARADATLTRVEAFRAAERPPSPSPESFDDDDDDDDDSGVDPHGNNNNNNNNNNNSNSSRNAARLQDDDDAYQYLAPSAEGLLPPRPPGSAGSDGTERRGRSTRSGSGAEGVVGTLRSSRNGRVTRGLLSGIMRMGRSDSPEGAKKT